MRVVIVYESLFGNSHQIAEAIGAGIRVAQPDSQVTCMRVGEADPGQVGAADLLVVGGPTHMRGMTFGRSRAMGLLASEKAHEEDGTSHQAEPGAEGPGVRDWFHSLPKAAEGRRAAAFDTHLGARMHGGAARAIARRLRHRGYQLVAQPEGFIVEDTEGPLRAGERDRAKAWGAALRY